MKRALGGLVLALIWSSAVAIGWVSTAVTTYGSIDKALDRMKLEPSSLIPLAAYFATAPASFLGGWVGSMCEGASPLEGRVIRGSLVGAAIATFLAALLGFATGWAASTLARELDHFLMLALGLGSMAGICGGISSGLIFRSRRQLYMEPRERSTGSALL
ncbi:MAG: hypothetical protein U0744_22085 [Gemmataceae bacterium]